MSDLEQELIALAVVFVLMVSFEKGWLLGLVILTMALMVSPIFGGATK